MATVVVMTLEHTDGDPAPGYDAIMEEMDLGGTPPDGARFHVAGHYRDGWRVIDVWDDMAKFGQFAETQIGPLSAKNGFSPPQVETYELEEVLDGPQGTPGFAQVVRVPLGADDFHAMHDRVLPDGAAPDQCVWHVNGPAGDGWIVVDTWSSRDARDAFMQASVMPNAPDGAVPTIEDLEVHNFMG